MSAPTSFGLWIRQRRRLLDMTQEQLAAKVGCSHSAIRKIESDERRPSLQVAELLADALQISPAERSLFLRIARMELRITELASISAPVAAPVSAMVTAPAVAPPMLSAAPSREREGFRLPVPPTPLVGRDVEVVQIVSTLLNEECRLLTLVGPGGIGKSRLALAVAQRLGDNFADGVALAPLAGVESAADMAFAVAGALEIGQYGHADPLRQLQVFLRDKQLLLILDSMEHLLDGGDVLVPALLQAAPDLKILATSREQLSLLGEWLFQVRGLSTPETEDVSDWEHSSAMRLFVQSARRANVAFSPDADDTAAIARICRLVEGMPLAIELAASWVRVLGCAEIAAEIERDWGFLSGATRDMPVRHRSLRAVFDQSWSLLSESERSILRGLSVFRRGFRREAAASVAGASLLDLASLSAKSLVNPVSASPAGAVPAPGDRFEVQELVRQYAAERLAADPAQEEVFRRHAGYFRDLAAQLEPELHGPRQAEVLDRLEAELDNLRAALAWLAEHDPDGGLQLASALWWFWFVRGLWKEALRWLGHLLEGTAGSVTPVRAGALARAANMAWMTGDRERASRYVDEALDVAEACHDVSSRVLAEYVLGQVATHHDMLRSTAAFRRSLELARASGERWGEARSLYRLGINAFIHDDLPAARRLYEESLAIFRALGDAWGIYAALSDTGGVLRRMGELDEALRIGHESLAICRSLGFRQGAALELLSLGIVYWERGDFEQARAVLNESRRAFAEIDNKRGIADAQLQLGHTALWAGDRREATVQFEHALRVSRETGFAPSITSALHGLAVSELQQGNRERARALLRETVATEQASPGLRFYLAAVLESAAALAHEEGRDEAAARFMGAAAAMRARYTAVPAPVEQGALDTLRARLRSRLGDERSAGAEAAGAAWSADKAMEAMLADLG